MSEVYFAVFTDMNDGEVEALRATAAAMFGDPAPEALRMEKEYLNYDVVYDAFVRGKHPNDGTDVPVLLIDNRRRFEKRREKWREYCPYFVTKVRVCLLDCPALDSGMAHSLYASALAACAGIPNEAARNEAVRQLRRDFADAFYEETVRLLGADLSAYKKYRNRYIGVKTKEALDRMAAEGQTRPRVPRGKGETNKEREIKKMMRRYYNDTGKLPSYEKMKQYFIENFNIKEEEFRYCSRTTFYKYKRELFGNDLPPDSAP